MSLEFKPNISASPIYVAGASIEDMQKQYGLEDFIKMGSNESPVGPSPLAVQAMQLAAVTLNRYPPMGDEGLRTVLAESLGQGLKPDNFITGNGGCDVLEMIATAFLKPGDECIICRPTFPVYNLTASRAGADVVYVDLNPEHFDYDVETILAAVTEKTRVLYICSPNNPTGNMMTSEQIETLLDNIPSHVLLVADEVYYHFVNPENRLNLPAYVHTRKNMAVLHSFSKALALSGLRLGYGIASPETAQYLSRARKPFHLNKFVVEGGIAAIQDTAHIKKGVDLVVAGRNWLYEQLATMDIQVWPSQGNFMLLKPPFDAAEVSERLLQHGVIIRPMANFYLPAHLRLTVGLPEENERFINALQQVLAKMETEGVSKVEIDEPDSGEFKF